MRNDRHIAEQLRRKGKSYNFISRELEIPKSTISEWFARLAWSVSIRQELARRANYVARKRLRIINRERKKKWEQWREGFRKEARKEFPKLLKEPLFATGIALYWL